MDFEDIPEATNDESTNIVEEQAQAPPPLPEPQGYDAFTEVMEPQDALAAFNKEWNAKLEIKRAQEVEHEKTVKAQATEELANWKQQREIRLKARKEKNRSEEQVLLETLESEADGSNTWERVTKLIDANQGDAAPADKADVGRMRKLFIQLKGEPLDKTRAAVKA